jgi:hypothetical protein
MKTNPWSEIDKLMAEEILHREDGWFSMKDFTDKYGCLRSTGQSRIEVWVGSGVIEKKTKVVVEGRLGTYYRFKAKK